MRLRYLIGTLAFAAAQYGSVKLSLEFTIVGHASIAWLPAGVGIGLLAFFGLRFWPGIFAGDLLALGATGVPVGTLLGETLGNTAQALVGAALLAALVDVRRPFARIGEVMALVCLAAPLGALVSALAGATSLVAGGVVPSGSFGSLLERWFLADTAGALVVAPPLLLALAAGAGARLPAERRPEALALAAALALSIWAAFFWTSGSPYLVFPVLVWAALRFLQPGAAAAGLLVSAVAVAATAADASPFGGATLEDRLLQAQLFVGVASVTTLVLAVATAERLRAHAALHAGERRLAAAARQQHAVVALGHRAAGGCGLDDLFADAARTVAATLLVERSEVRERLATGEERVRAAAGDDVGEDGTGVAVGIPGADGAFGVLAVRTSAERSFTEDEAGFLEAVSNVLGNAIRRLRHEERILESEERLRLALEAGDLRVWNWDLEADTLVGGFVTLGPKGRTRTLERFLRKVHPDDREHVATALGRAIDRGESYHAEYRLRTDDDGEHRWILSAGRAVPGGEGRPRRLVGVATDVTGRKRAEDELRRSRELYRIVVENTEELVALYDLEGRFVYASPSYERVLGLTAAELIGTNAFDLVHEDDLSAAREAFASAAAGPGVVQARGRLRRKDGSWLVGEGSATVVCDDRGEPSLVLSTARDVTERLAADEALRAAEQRYRNLVEHLPLVTYVDSLDELSSNIYTSPQIEPLLGYPVEQWMHDPELFVKTLHPEDRERVLTEHARAHETGEALRTEYRLLARDGRVVWLQDEAVVVRDDSGRPLYLQGYLVDITRRKESQTALAERENLLQTIIETEPECVKLVAPDGTLLQMNRAGLAMIEADSPEQVLGRVVGELIAPEYRAAFDALNARAIAGESGNLEFDLIGLKGTRRRMDTHVVPLRGADGEVRAALSVTRDVTERRRLEDELRQSQKMEAVGRLAGGIAHDFNNLLTGIIGYADLLRAGLAEDDERRDDAEEIRKAADRAAALTRQLLAFSRRQVLQPRVLDLNEVVFEMERMLRRLIGEDVELVTEAAPDLGAVEADPGQIEQVVANLVVNSRDAMPGGGRVVVRTSNVEVSASSRRAEGEMAPGPYVLLSVADTGVGMDGETRARVFEPFFTTKEVGKGTGLGLATVYGIVKQSGGYIWVESEPGAGARFDVYLPRVEKSVESESARAGQREPARGGDETILVVEDESLVRELIARDLTGRGYTVLTAADGLEALALASAREDRIDLLVTDVVMPEIGGLELTRQLCSRYPDLRVVYMSGYAERPVVAELAPWPLLQKPFDVSALAGAVREVLDVHAAA